MSGGGASKISSAAKAAEERGIAACCELIQALPASPLMTGPNRFQVVPSKRMSCSCRIGAKFVELVLISMPGVSDFVGALADHTEEHAKNTLSEQPLCSYGAGQRKIGAKNPQQHPVVVSIEANRAAVEVKLTSHDHCVAKPERKDLA